MGRNPIHLPFTECARMVYDCENLLIYWTFGRGAPGIPIDQGRLKYYVRVSTLYELFCFFFCRFARNNSLSRRWNAWHLYKFDFQELPDKYEVTEGTFIAVSRFNPVNSHNVPFVTLSHIDNAAIITTRAPWMKDIARFLWRTLPINIEAGLRGTTYPHRRHMVERQQENADVYVSEEHDAYQQSCRLVWLHGLRISRHLKISEPSSGEGAFRASRIGHSSFCKIKLNGTRTTEHIINQMLYPSKCISKMILSATVVDPTSQRFTKELRKFIQSNVEIFPCSNGSSDDYLTHEWAYVIPYQTDTNHPSAMVASNAPLRHSSNDTTTTTTKVFLGIIPV